MKKLLLILALIVCGCNRDLSPLNTTTTSYAPTAVTTPVVSAATVWCNFETDVSSGFWWPGGPTGMTNSWSTDTAYSGSHSWKMAVGAGVGYGHWDGLSLSPSPSVPAGGSSYNMWIKINQNLTTQWHISEGTTFGQGQDWVTTLNLTANPAWQLVSIPLSSFTTTDPGDGMVNTNDINQVWFYNTAPYPAYTIYIDDIAFP